MKSVAVDLSLNGKHRLSARESDLVLLWTNLVENAIQHSAPSSQVRVEVSDAGQNDCRVQIVDSGSGIEPADLPHIFERFYRSDCSRSRATGGFGLGLSIAKAIVDSLHGTIAIESTPHVGTTVTVTLPIAPNET
jgi:signal transduction histidine kinase